MAHRASGRRRRRQGNRRARESRLGGMKSIPTRLPHRRARVLITGGCGFIGANLSHALASRGREVLILDNLARPGVQENANWLKSRHGDLVAIEVADIRDEGAVRTLVARASSILHLAAQVAVTTSLESPIEDFEINARGTLNILEAVRRQDTNIPILFASTNKVYGRLLAPHQL